MLCRHSVASLLLVFAAVVADSAAAVDFATQVQPIFVEHCAKCHGAEKGLGKLRLHTAEAISASPHKDLAIAGKPEESELYKRLILPADDKKRMPKGAEPLPAEKIELVKQWIAEGAKLTTTEAAPAPAPTTPAPAPSTTAAEPPKNEAPAEDAEAKKLAVELAAELAAVQPASAEAIAAVTAAGGAVLPLFNGSPLLDVSFARSETPPGDATVATLAGVADQVAALNLAGAKVTAAGLAPLAKLKHLQRLHLEKSNVDAAGLAHLAGNRHLEYLNLYATPVGDDALPTLASLPSLTRLFLWDAKASYDGAMGLKTGHPRLAIDMGWNHPRVVKDRLTKEVEVVKANAAAAQAKFDELQKQLDAAKAERDGAAARLKATDEELKKLDAPAG